MVVVDLYSILFNHYVDCFSFGVSQVMDTKTLTICRICIPANEITNVVETGKCDQCGIDDICYKVERCLAPWFERLNQERIDLIYKDELTPEESIRFDELQFKIFEELHRVHPPSPSITAELDRIENALELRENH